MAILVALSKLEIPSCFKPGPSPPDLTPQQATHFALMKATPVRAPFIIAMICNFDLEPLAIEWFSNKITFYKTEQTIASKGAMR